MKISYRDAIKRIPRFSIARRKKYFSIHSFFFLIRILAAPNSRIPTLGFEEYNSCGRWRTADGDLLEISQLIMYLRNAAISSCSPRGVLHPFPGVRGFFLKEFDIEFFALGPRWWRTRRRGSARAVERGGKEDGGVHYLELRHGIYPLTWSFRAGDCELVILAGAYHRVPRNYAFG